MCNIPAGENAFRGMNAAVDCVRAMLLCAGASSVDSETLDLKGKEFDGAQLAVHAILGFLRGYAACHDEGCLLRQTFEIIANDVERANVENA